MRMSHEQREAAIHCGREWLATADAALTALSIMPLLAAPVIIIVAVMAYL